MIDEEAIETADLHDESAPEQPRGPDGKWTAEARESDGEEAPNESDENNAEAEEVEASADDAGESDQSSDDEESNEPKRGGIAQMQERIRQLTAQKRQAEAQASMLQQQLQQYQPQQIDPDLEFEDNGEFTRQTVHQALQEQAAQAAYAQSQQAAQMALQTSAAIFQERVEAARETMPDFDQVFTPDVPISETAVEFLGESDLGPQVAYHLAKNRAEAFRIAQMHPVKQAIALARIESRLSKAPAPRKTTAPPPAKKVSARANPQSRDPAGMSMEEYRKFREGSAA